MIENQREPTLLTIIWDMHIVVQWISCARPLVCTQVGFEGLSRRKRTEDYLLGHFTQDAHCFITHVPPNAVGECHPCDP